MFYKAWPLIVAMAWLIAGPAAAQDAQEAPVTSPLLGTDPAGDAVTAATADEVVAAAAERLRPHGVPAPCPQPESGVIVVCSQTDDGAQRVPSSTDEAIAAGLPVSDGRPRAPDLFGIPSGGVSIKMGSPPPQVYVIDLKAIPEAPAGSDAARYAEDPSAEPAPESPE